MRSRSSKHPKYVYEQRIKGHTYYRFRKTGGGSVRLPGTPGTAEFHAAYAKLLTTRPNLNPGRYTPGSVAHSIDLFYRSAEFSQLAAGTQRDYRAYLNRLDRSVGERALASIDSAYLYQVRDKLRATPVAANHTIAIVRTLFRFAISRAIVTADPTVNIGKLKGGDGYRRWADAEIAQFLDHEHVDATMKLALVLGLYTGQRLSDVIRLTWSNYDGQRIRLRQQKTGTPLSIAIHPRLRSVLDGCTRTGVVILVTKTGRAFHPRVFSRSFREARIAAGLPEGLSFHGLRHTAAARLAELGAGAPEIQAVTGHKSLKLVEHYIRQASQEVQADRAIARLR